MNTDFLMAAFYPVSILNLSDNQKNEITILLKSQFGNIDEIALNTVFESKQTIDQLKISALNEADRKKCFDTAKLLIEKTEMSMFTLKRLSELGKALNISDTGLDFNIYDDNDVKQYEFIKTVRNFSAVAAAIGFIPFIPFSDYIIITTIQIGMAAKIANIYDYRLDAAEFVKLIGGTIGTGLIFRLFSKILCSFLPVIGWAINAAVAYAGTYAMGILTKKYIEAKGELSPENILKIWENSFEEGKKEFNNLKDYILEKKDQLLKELEKIKESINKNRNNETGGKNSGQADDKQEKPKTSRSKKQK